MMWDDACKIYKSFRCNILITQHIVTMWFTLVKLIYATTRKLILWSLLFL